MRVKFHHRATNNLFFMSNYLVSARKYRPITFGSVVGQQALTTTLKNSIISGKLAHSYLFCGPRGVGKTTCARLFAKAINCEHLSPEGEPCGECASCRTFNAEQRSYNVFELDAASNNGVDDIRNLTEQVRIPPVNGRYKVYVIDEVHMLSTQAFNAFLKTLEEPPAYAVFILATTEKHKVIPTILSRCQIYDFNRISNTDIVGHLRDVAVREGIETDDDALMVIAEQADGGMRDALSIFDQVTSFTAGHVTYKETIRNLNVLDTNHYFRLTDLMLENKVPECLLQLNDILSHGFDAGHLVTGLMAHFRNLLVSRDTCTLPLLETSDEMRERYKVQAAKCQPKFIYKALKLCNSCDLNYQASKNKRLLVELTLIRIAQSAVGEDDDSDGRGPAALKPIFSEQARQPQTQSQRSGIVVTAGKSPAENVRQKKETEPEAGIGRTAVPHVPAQPQPGRNMPKISRGSLFQSINAASQPDSDEEKPQHGESSEALPKVSEYRKVQPLEKERLDMLWKDYAMQLTQVDSPLMNRMMNSLPEILSDTEFQVTVMNGNAANEFRSNGDGIIGYLREKFNNNGLSMKVVIDQTRKSTRILSPAEQLAKMMTDNTSMGELVEKFGLELM